MFNTELIFDWTLNISFDLISESPEKRQKIENVETVFFTNAGEERNDQKCVIALCENPVLSKEGEPWKDLYVAFRGTDVDDYKDVLTGNYSKTPQ